MQVEIKKNIYMQQTSPDEISMVYVNVPLITFQTERELKKTEAYTLGKNVLRLIKKTPSLKRNLTSIQKKYEDNPVWDMGW